MTATVRIRRARVIPPTGAPALRKMSIGCLSTQNVDAEIKPKLISLNTRLCRQNRIVNLNEFYPYPTDNGTRQAAGELRAQVMTGSGAKQPHSTASCSDRIRSGKPTLA